VNERGYGNGLAADVISVKAQGRSERLDSTRLQWDRIDRHTKHRRLA
jgi:hypothetical protein